MILRVNGRCRHCTWGRLEMKKSWGSNRIIYQAEALKKSALEKCELQLDNHFRKIEIADLKDQIRLFKNEISELNILIEKYEEMYRKYREKDESMPAFNTGNLSHEKILHELYELINKKLTDLSGQQLYLPKLKDIDAGFFREMNDVYQDLISTNYIKYCICFAIGMENSHIAECFSVEITSVYMIKYRLKLQAGLDKTTDFGLFLRKWIRVGK